MFARLFRVLQRSSNQLVKHSYPNTTSISIQNPTNYTQVRFKRIYRGNMSATKLTEADVNTEISVDFSPPKTVNLMTELDRDLFVKTVYVPGLVIPQLELNKARKKLWKYVLRIPKTIPIREYNDAEKVVLLNPEFCRSREDACDEIKDSVEGIVEFGAAYRALQLDLTYENWTADDILKAVLPEEQSISGFTIMGHVAHFNLRSCHEPYKALIGQVILDKVANIRTVVNKTDTIDNVYRFFSMEILAGDGDTIVSVKENGCCFQFDFAKVYWNSRLGSEHERVVKAIKTEDILYDVFAGVGPFAVPCARQGTTVIANDLNPESFKWLNENVKSNSSKRHPCRDISTFNMDGREFIHDVVSRELLKQMQETTGKIHIVMNLPALAVEFLDAFIGLLDEEPSCELNLPIVHCYTFSKCESSDSSTHDAVKDVRAKIESVLGANLPADHVIRHVRTVSPNKDMLCATFRLDKEVLFRQTEGSERKRIKLSDS